jgi:hypothetical protein
MSTYIPVALRQQVLALEQGYCAYCQGPEVLMGVTFEIEHIFPLAAGGETVLMNLCLSCPTCNRYKAARLTAYDPENHIEVPLFHPRQQVWSEHFTGNADATQLLGLTPIGRATILALQINRPVIQQLRRYWHVLKLHPRKLS